MGEIKVKFSMDEESELFEMANYRHSKMAMFVPCNIWAKISNMLSKHNKSPSAKFQINTHDKFEPENLAEITLSKTNPEIIASRKKIELSSSEITQLKQWIMTNYEPLMKFWNLEIDSVELGNILYKKEEII